MLIKPITSLLKEQQVKPEDMSYLGCVEDNKDPKMLGRIKVRIEIFADVPSEDLPWAYPLMGGQGNSSVEGGLNVPEIGSQVRITFPSKDLTAPYYSGAELNELNRTKFFDCDYPATYGFKDSVGNFFAINKAQKTAEFGHSSGTTLQIAPDGSVKLSLGNGAFAVFNNDLNFSLYVGTIEIKGTPDGTLSLTANSEISLKTNSLNILGDVKVRGGFTPAGGVSGSFITNGNYVEVTDGIITAIK